MAILIPGAAPAAPATSEHRGGDDEDGCLACWNDQYEDLRDLADITPCRTAEPDPAEPDLCRWCSHTIEAVPAPASLPCPDCENVACRCAA